MSYIDLEQPKVPGPGRYEEFRYNDTPNWSMRPRVNSERMKFLMKFILKPLKKLFLDLVPMKILKQ